MIDDLKAALRDMGSVVVAFSGGVDSAVVLAAAVSELGTRALAVTATSPSVAQGEVDIATAVAASVGAAHEIIQTREFDDPRYRANPVNRCYYCKEELYSKLTDLARERGFAHVVDGCNADDGRAALDRRPGRAAAAVLGVRSPLAELGIGKAEVRAIAERFGLAVWNKPATPCLSSRVPYGTRIETDDLRRIDLAERYLRASGFSTVRVRHYGTTARVEVPDSDIDRLRAIEERVARTLATVGYSAIEIDPRGYRLGSLNERASGA
jgi:pyridinium-3,5-biscarboxylic acid mononucleotide sulfurtransferase